MRAYRILFDMGASSTDDQSFAPVRVTTLRGDLKIPFDLYVKVAGKYIHYCRAGESFEGVRLQRLKAKKLKRMYIRLDDQPPYEQYLEQSIDQAYDLKSNKAAEIRAEVIQGFQQAAAESFMENPLDEFAYNQMKSSLQRFTEFILREPSGARSFLNLENTDHSISHHGVAVAALSVCMTLDNGLREGQPVHLMALGCLLHDIEHYFSEFDLNRSIASFGKEDMKTYREHPINGALLLQKATFVDQLVMKIISQHEEHVDGSGFPKGLFEKDMDQLVMVVATANAYDRLRSFEGRNAKDALKHLLVDKMGAFPLAHLQTLQDLLKRFKLV